MNYRIVITETLKRIIEIDAGGYEEAELKTIRQYYNEDIVLDSADFTDVKFEVLYGQGGVVKE